MSSQINNIENKEEVVTFSLSLSLHFYPHLKQILFKGIIEGRCGSRGKCKFVL